MLLPSRNGNSSNYRYGFNGMEKDDEIKGEGNSVNYKYRMHDPRVGRFFALDPLAKNFSDVSHYNFASNTPVVAIDQDGGFTVWRHYHMTKKALIKAGIKRKTARQIAHFASTYADHPTAGILLYNLGVYGGMRGATTQELDDLLYQDGHGGYDATKESQSDELVASVSIHAMRTYWEEIDEETAIKRSLYGGTFIDKDNCSITIVGAYEVIDSFKGKDIEKLSIQDKKRLGVALHTIQDAVSHKGKRWVDDHEKEAEKMGHENEHPDFDEVVLAKNYYKALKDTEKAIKTITEKNSSNSNNENK